MRRSYRGPLAFVVVLSAGGCERGCGCGPDLGAGCSLDLGSGGGCDFQLQDPDAGCSYYDDCPDSIAVKPDFGTVDPPDAGRTSCINPYGASVGCDKPKARPGKTVCTDAMIEALLPCFGPASGASDCYLAKETYAACAQCVTEDSDGAGPVGWIDVRRVDEGACIGAIDPKSSCGTTIHCTLDCVEDSCFDCSKVAGTGSTKARSEWEDCRATVLGPLFTSVDAGGDEGDAGDPGDAGDADETSSGAPDATVVDAVDASDSVDADDGASDSAEGGSDAAPGEGACWPVASGWAACRADPRYRRCFVESTADLVMFFRGACRDGADWSRAHLSDGTGDAGVADALDASATDADASDAEAASDTADAD